MLPTIRDSPNVRATTVGALAVRLDAEHSAARGAQHEGTRRLCANFSQVLGTHALAALAGIASLPVLARQLGPEGYGAFSLQLTLLGVVTYQDFLRPLLVRAFATGAGAVHEDLRALSFAVGALLALGALALGFALFPPATAISFSIAVGAHVLASVGWARLSAEGRVGLAATVRNVAWASAALCAAVLALSVHGRDPALQSFVCGAPFALANIAIALVYRRLAGTHERAAPFHRLRAAAQRAWSEHKREIQSLVGFGLANALVVSADRVILEHFGSARTFGMYAGTQDMAVKMTLIGTALGTVLYPSFARGKGSGAGETTRFVRIVTLVMVAWSALIATLIVCSEPITALVLGEQFRPSHGLYALALVGVWAHMLGFLITPWQRARGEFGLQTRAYAAAGVAMIVVGLVLVPRFGAAGALATYLTARSAEIALCIHEVRRTPSANLPRGRVVALGIIGLALGALAVQQALGGG